MTEDQIAAGLIRRASRLNRLLIPCVLGAALSASFFFTYAVVSDGGAGGIIYGKILGITGGMTWAASFATLIGLGLFLSRRLLIKRLQQWIAEDCRKNVLDPRDFDYIISMYAKAHRRESPESSRKR